MGHPELLSRLDECVEIWRAEVEDFDGAFHVLMDATAGAVDLQLALRVRALADEQVGVGLVHLERTSKVGP